MSVISNYIKDLIHEGDKGKVTYINNEMCYLVITSFDNINYKVNFSNNNNFCLEPYNKNNISPLELEEEVYFIFHGLDENNISRYSINKKSIKGYFVLLTLFLILICLAFSFYFLFKNICEETNNDRINNI